MNASSPTEAKLRWAPGWVLAFVALWPLPGPAEMVLSLGAVIALSVLAYHRFRDGITLLSHEAWALTTVLFLAYWLPELVSSIDAVDAGRALRESLIDLRYLPFLWLVAIAVGGERGRRITFVGIAAIATLWTLALNDNRVRCAVYRATEGFQLRIESPGGTILTEPFELQPRMLARSKALHTSLKRRGWHDPPA